MNKYIFFTLIVCTFSILLTYASESSSETKNSKYASDSIKEESCSSEHQSKDSKSNQKKGTKKHGSYEDHLDNIILDPELTENLPSCYNYKKTERYQCKKNNEKLLQCMKIATYLLLLDKADCLCNAEYNCVSTESNMDSCEPTEYQSKSKSSDSHSKKVSSECESENKSSSSHESNIKSPDKSNVFDEDDTCENDDYDDNGNVNHSKHKRSNDNQGNDYS